MAPIRKSRLYTPAQPPLHPQPAGRAGTGVSAEVQEDIFHGENVTNEEKREMRDRAAQLITDNIDEFAALVRFFLSASVVYLLMHAYSI